MKNIPATFMGPLIATIVATGIVIFDTQKFLLWDMPARSLIMGGASLVLLTYSISWFFLESFAEKTSNGEQLMRGEYWVRLTTQTLLGLALAAIGTDVGLYFWLFAAFIALNFVSTYMVSHTNRSVTIHEGVNVLLCCIYALLALKLFSAASDFDSTYPTMRDNSAALNTRKEHLLAQMSNAQMFLGFVVGMIMVNLGLLLSKFPWMRDSKLFSGASSAREQQ